MIDHRSFYYGNYNNQVDVIYLIRKSTLVLMASIGQGWITIMEGRSLDRPPVQGYTGKLYLLRFVLTPGRAYGPPSAEVLTHR